MSRKPQAAFVVIKPVFGALGLALLILAAAAGVRAQGQGPQQGAWRDIDIASEGAHPPFNFLDQNNELAGFEIDLARELCQRMQARCRFSTQEWDSLIPNLLSGQYDAIMAALDITEERLQKIAFSNPYVRMPQAFVAARRREIRSATPDALAERTIGVEADGPHQSYLETIYPKSTIKAYGGLDEAMLDLAEGRIDVVFADKDAAMDFLKNRREAQCCKFLATIPRDPAFFGEGIGIGLRQGDKELKTLFDKALDEAIADGTFARIRAKYWDFEIR
jgi:polar amino acid transport system substrate-binding protein